MAAAKTATLTSPSLEEGCRKPVWTPEPRSEVQALVYDIPEGAGKRCSWLSRTLLEEGCDRLGVWKPWAMLETLPQIMGLCVCV